MLDAVEQRDALTEEPGRGFLEPRREKKNGGNPDGPRRRTRDASRYFDCAAGAGAFGSILPTWTQDAMDLPSFSAAWK